MLMLKKGRMGDKRYSRTGMKGQILLFFPVSNEEQNVTDGEGENVAMCHVTLGFSIFP